VRHRRIDAGREFGLTDAPWFAVLNPNRTVPVLVHEGRAIWESHAILRFVADLWGRGGFRCDDPAERAGRDMWMDWTISVLLKGMHPLFWQLIRTPEDARDPEAVRTGYATAAAAWTMLDRHLAEREWVSGDVPGLADIPLGAFAHRWFALPLAPLGGHGDLPELARWFAQLKARPAYRRDVMIPLS